jgi:rifampicin phosphotransferase
VPSQTHHLCMPSSLPPATGGKGARLAAAQAKGLPVPRFWLFSEESLQALIRQGIVTETDGEFGVTDPAELAQAATPTDAPPFLAVRSAFSAEDTATHSLAGRFETCLHVPAASAQAMADAVLCVWNSARREPAVARRDILLMTMVKAHHAGVAFLESDFPNDLVNFTTGTGDQLVSGGVQGERLELARRSSEKASRNTPPWQTRLQRLLQQVRRCFGDAPWDVEWADDGKRCWLLQVRPVTQRTLRDELFTMANHREILPDPPSWFMTTLIASCAGGLFAYYRGFDERLPAGRPFIEILYGRPLINLSLLLDMMRLWGLPSRLVTDSIGGSPGPDAEFAMNPLRLLRSLPVLARQAWAQCRAPRQARTTASKLARMADEATAANATAHSVAFGPLITQAATIYTLLVQEMFSLTAAISGPTALLRRAGVLAAFSRQHRSISTQINDDLAMVAHAVRKTPGGVQKLREGLVPGGDPFIAEWQKWLKNHGHRGVYESDLSMPRFHEQPELLLATLRVDRAQPDTRSPLPLPAWLLYPVWLQARSAIAAREQLRSDAMRAFDRLRQLLLHQAHRAVEAGQLPSPEHLWKLSVEECRRLDAGWVPDEAFWRKREADEARRAGLQVPNVVRRFAPLPSADGAASQLSNTARWQGIGLSPGTVEGRAWVVDRPLSRLPEGFLPETTILIARAVDAGWIPTFALVAGVAVEIGGDLSHGSIILRELGLPAVTNVSGILGAVRTGDQVRLEGQRGAVELTASAETVPAHAAQARQCL